MLTLFEEVVLLTLNPKTGRLQHGKHDAIDVRYALAAAILFDLALEKRIDTDAQTITVIDATPTGHAIHDSVLAGLAKRAEAQSVRQCIETVRHEHPDLEADALASLIERGVISKQTRKALGGLLSRDEFPLLDGAPRLSVVSRLAQAVLGSEIPDVRDIMLVSVAHACGLLELVLVPTQIEARQDWIDSLTRIETIARNLNEAIGDLYADMARNMHFPL